MLMLIFKSRVFLLDEVLRVKFCVIFLVFAKTNIVFLFDGCLINGCFVKLFEFFISCGFHVGLFTILIWR